MNKKYLIVISFLLSSCMATQKDMLVLQSQIDDLNTNIYTLKKNQADLSLKIDDLNRNLTSFSENTKDLSIDISKLSAKIDDYGALTDKKINQIGKNATQKSEKEEEYSKECLSFYKAMSMYSSKKYEQAIELLKDYIIKYPKGENLDNAYFYLAQSLFEIENYKESGIFYAKIISGYPNFPETPYVRLKYSKSLIELNDKSKLDEAITYLKSVEKDFPTSIEAIIAKQILYEITPKKVTKNTQTKRK